MVKDKLATINVLGSLIKRPSILQDAHYKLTPDDFPERFHRVVFGAVDYLIHDGVQVLDEIIIDDYLKGYPNQHELFEANQGMDYIINAVDASAPDNFDYWYKALKKCTLLNELEKRGFNISSYYNAEALHVDEQETSQEKLDNADVDSILDSFEGELIDLRQAFTMQTESKGVQAGQGMRELKEEFKKVPEMGLGMNSKKLTTICKGRRRKKLYMKTLSTGGGKSRLSVADACLCSIPKIYDPDQKGWIITGCAEPTLIITTELEIDEVQSMIQAYVACVDENHICDGKYDEGEEARVDQAIDIIEQSSLYIEHMPNFDVDDIETTIKKYKMKYGVTMVFFDYVFLSTKMLMEMSRKTRGINLREDNVLVMFIDRMKTLANNLNIHIDTSTQANGDWKNNSDPDQNIIRGAKGMADKIDVGYCGLPPTQKDLMAVQNIISKGGAETFMPQPNLVYHIYKVRRGKLNHVKLFIYFDYATLRTKDLFVTDKDYKLLDVANTSVDALLDETDVTDRAEVVYSENEPEELEKPEEIVFSDDSNDYFDDTGVAVPLGADKPPLDW